ncbi:MAG: glycosyltransferase family 2 protein [Archaeoglobaceae archaeon]|nr:glycosyltransferase family 2 protein [Archaeoglobaceae archaeon]
MLLRTLVVILNKDNAEGLRRCLKSLIDQSLKICEDFDVLVIDGGSKDGSKEVVEEFSKTYPCVKFKVQKKLGGTGFARIESCDYAKNYKFVIWGDSENEYSKDYVEKIVKALEKYDVAGGIPIVESSFYGHAFAWYHALHLIVPKLKNYHVPGNNRGERTEIYKLATYPETRRAEDYGFSLKLMKAGIKLKVKVVDAKVKISLPKTFKDIIAWQKNRAKGAAEAAYSVKFFPYDSLIWISIFPVLIFSFLKLEIVIFLLALNSMIFLLTKRFLEKLKMRFFLAPIFGILIHSFFSLLTLIEFTKLFLSKSGKKFR